MKTILGLTGLLCLGWAFTLHGQDNWARFRGPDGLGKSQSPHIPIELSKSTTLWEVPTQGHGESSPVIFGKKLFYTVTPEGAPGVRDLVCLSTEDGEELLRKRTKFSEYTLHQFNSPASTSPTADEDRVYAWWNDGEDSQVFALDHEGKDLWKTSLGPFDSQHGGGSSVVVVDDVLLVQKINLHDESFIAGLDPASGEVRWKTPIPEKTKTPYVTPVIRETPQGKEAIYCSTESGVFALDVKSGNFRWQFDAEFEHRVVACPVLSGDTLFASCGGGGGGKDSVVIHVPAGTVEAKELYRPSKQLPYVPTGLGIDGKFFLINDGGVGTCYEAATGKQLWRERIVGKCFASPVAVEDRIYVFGRDGDYKIYRASDRFEPLAEGDLEEGIDTTPAIGDGKLFIRTEKRILCFQISAKA